MPEIHVADVLVQQMPRQRKVPQRYEEAPRLPAHKDASRKSKQKKVQQQRKRRQELREAEAGRVILPADLAAEGREASSPPATPSRKKRNYSIVRGAC